MTINIHHGPPGSYKSFSVVQRYMIPALLPDDRQGAPYPNGRTVVTNIRGFDSIENIEKVLGVKCGSEAQIISLQTETRDGLEHAARWFHWAPHGALIVLDEAQAVYPAARRDFKIESLDYPGGKEAAEADDRPADVLLAFDMHRHYNWDLFLCTPHIGKIHTQIRQSSQTAFRHWRMGELVPWKKNKWRELEHDPENNGKAASHGYGVPKEYKADLKVFDCYQSTKTGKATGAIGGHSIFKDRKLRMVAVILLCSFSYLTYAMFEIVERESARLNGGEVPLVEGAEASAVPVPDGSNGRAVSPGDERHSDDALVHPFGDVRLRIAGSINQVYLFHGFDVEGEFSVTQQDLASYGYRVLYLRPCYGQLWWNGQAVQDLYCQRSRVLPPDPRPDIEPFVQDLAGAVTGVQDGS